MAVNEVSKIYANSLLDVGVQKNKLPAIEEELRFIAGLISGDRELMLFLNAPVISKDKKKELIDKLFKDRFSSEIVSLIKVLVDNERQSLLPEINEYFNVLVDGINNRQKIKIITSVKLEDNVLKGIEKALSGKLKKNVYIEEEINESILGGIIIKIDDVLIDGSIAKDLNMMRRKLIERKIGSKVAYED